MADHDEAVPKEEEGQQQHEQSALQHDNPDLASFRRQWKVELGLDSSPSGMSTTAEDEANSDESEDEDDEDEIVEEDDDEKVEGILSVEDEAHELFQRGVHCERTGHFYDAIKFYKKALTLVPDIEHRFNQKQIVLAKAAEDRGSLQQSARPSLERGGDEDDEDEVELKERFLREIELNGWNWFEKIREDGKCHFADLPEEVVKYIVRWVVSNDLDVRSLDMLANVSKGFYVICRDDKLWENMCERLVMSFFELFHIFFDSGDVRIWGQVKTYRAKSEFSSYREMFLTRARVRFDGCYISKITYIRSGENSFQDQSYRPWHLVEYYRYIFFTPHGQFFFLTTSDLPANTIPYLRDPLNQTKFNNLLVGHYTLDEHHIYGQCWNPGKIRTKNSGGPNNNVIYNMVLQVLHLKKRFNSALHWIQYYVNIERGEAGILKNEFDIEQVKFPNFFYSRVKSFTRESREALC